MLTDFVDIPRKDRVIIALDCAADKAIAISYMLANEARWVKIGMTLYYAYGSDLIKILKERGYKVFLDLKFHDIPHQVEGAARSAAESGADMLTMHAIGGSDMMKAAISGAIEGSKSLGATSPAMLAITVLTSMNQQSIKEVGIDRTIDEQVNDLAKLASASGASGVVSSPNEASMLRGQLGQDALIVCPGVRPVGSKVGDQSRIATPLQAFENGASHIVVGRPITDSPDPVASFRSIVKELD